MRKKILFLGVLIAAFAFQFAACAKETPIEPPVIPGKITSVHIAYGKNDSNQPNIITGGVLSVDITLQNLKLDAVIKKTDDSVDGTYTFASSKVEVAEVTKDGNVTLKAKGETIITLSAADKQHKIALVVGDDFSTPNKYTVTVIGGRSDKTAAGQGDYVTINAEIPEHKEFVKWIYTVDDQPVEDLWINGNVFAMPNDNIVITAEYTDKFYTLNVQGGKVKGDDSGEQDGELTTYKYKYDTPITVVADKEPAGKMFVGWDVKVKNNRPGELGAKEYTFTMPGESLALWAIFSDKSEMGFTRDPDLYKGSGFKKISNGIPASESADPDLEGMSGWRLSIPAGTTGSENLPENIRGSALSTRDKGSHTIKVIFKNHHKTLPVVIEFGASYYGALATTGAVTVPADSVVVKYFIAGLGIHNPYMGVIVKEDIGGGASDGNILLDMVIQKAPTYPEGDKMFEISGAAQWIHLSEYTIVGWPREKVINNNLGMSMIAVYGGNLQDNAYMYSPVTNLPEYSEDTPTTRIYLRVINAANRVGSFRFQYSKVTDAFDEDNRLGYHDVVLEPNQVEVFAIDVARAEADSIYFQLVKAIRDSSDNLYGHNIVFQMAYNNIFGYVGA